MIFERPVQYVGRDVIACGTLSGTANIYSWDNAELGLSIDGGEHAGEIAQLAENSNVCLAGSIRRLGCKTDPDIICNDWAYDYLIKVEEVLEVQRLQTPISIEDLRRLPS